VGGANVDYLVRGPSLPGPGDTVQGNEFQMAPGGKGANQAVAAARLGARVAFVGCIGEDAGGGLLVDHLVADGVDTRFLRTTSEVATGVAVIQVDAQGEKQIMVAPGANTRLTEQAVREALAAIASVRVVLTQFEVPMPVVMAAAKLARERGAIFVLDPAPPADVPNELLPLVDVIRPNAGEARALTGIDITGRESASRAARALLARGVRAVVVQASDDGDLAVWRDGDRFLPRIPVDTIDATGAGDAYAAALAVRLGEGASLEEAAPFASAAAALTTTRLGAQAALPHRADVFALLNR
jgi:ribokinase